MITDFANILSLAPKPPPRNTFTDVAKANAEIYPRLLQEAQGNLLSAAARKQDLDFDREKLDLDRKRVDAEIKINNSAGRRQGKGAVALALLPTILEGFTKKRSNPDRFAGDLLAAAFQGNNINSLAGFNDLVEQLNRARGAMVPWNSTPGLIESAVKPS